MSIDMQALSGFQVLKEQKDHLQVSRSNLKKKDDNTRTLYQIHNFIDFIWEESDTVASALHTFKGKSMDGSIKCSKSIKWK